MVMDIKLLQNWHFAAEHIFAIIQHIRLYIGMTYFWGSFGAMTVLHINKTPVTEILVVRSPTENFPSPVMYLAKVVIILRKCDNVTDIAKTLVVIEKFYHSIFIS